MNRTLQEISDSMVQALNNGDIESAHSEADDLLIEVINKIAETFSPNVRTKLLRIIQTYKQIDKWYA